MRQHHRECQWTISGHEGPCRTFNPRPRPCDPECLGVYLHDEEHFPDQCLVPIEDWPKEVPTLEERHEMLLETARSAVEQHGYNTHNGHWERCQDIEMKALHEAIEREEQG